MELKRGIREKCALRQVGWKDREASPLGESSVEITERLPSIIEGHDDAEVNF